MGIKHGWAAIAAAVIGGVTAARAVATEAPFLVKQVNGSSRTVLPCGSDDHVLEAAGLVLFQRDGELWRTDGTEAGTFLVKDLCPGLCDSDIPAAVEAGGSIYFLHRAEDPSATLLYPQELWRTDGTAAGTTRVMTLTSSNLHTGISDLASAGGRLFLSGAIGAATGIWSSDGTAAGTLRVAANVTWRSTVAVGNRLFFVGWNTTYGLEVWRSDGTPAGTFVLKDVRPGYADSYPSELTPFKSGVLFFANSEDQVTRLWKSDGTTGGTVELPMTSDALSSWGEWICSAGSIAIFSRYRYPGPRQIWSTDGTPAGTRKVIADAYSDSGLSMGPRPLAAGGLVYFVFDADDNSPDLWATDGTTAGTRHVGPWIDGYPSLLASAGGKALMLVWDKATQNMVHLWSSDGTQAGTRPLVELTPNAYFGMRWGTYSAATWAIVVGWASPLGTRVLRTDGTPEGTSELFAGRDGPLGSYLEAPSTLPRAGDSVLYFADRGAGCEMWSTDGTAPGTFRLAGGPGAGMSHFGPVLDANGVLLFGLGLNEALARWTSDGTPEGTRELPIAVGRSIVQAATRTYSCAQEGISRTDFERFSPVFSQAGSWTRCWPLLAPLRGGLLFPGLDDGAGIEPWFVPGAEGGAARLADAFPGPTSSSPTQAVDMGGFALFGASESETARGLWRTDGTGGGTVRIAAADEIRGFSRARNRAYFLPVSSTSDLGVSDGTPAGTATLPIAGGSEMATIGDRVFVASRESASALWASDGHAEDTRILKEFPFTRYNLSPSRLTPVGQVLYFVADDGAHGRELWKSDGTAAGTAMVKDIDPGEMTSEPEYLAAAGAALYFAASDGESGQELWRSDGSEAGTVMVADLCPGPCPSSPGKLTLVGNLLFFDASDGAAGRQLWALRLPVPNADAGDALAAMAPYLGREALVEVTLDAAPSAPVNVSYRTADGSARAGIDYDAVEGSLTFLPGNEPRQIVRVPLHECAGGTYFFLELTAADGAAIRRRFAEITVTSFTGPLPRIRQRTVGRGVARAMP